MMKNIKMCSSQLDDAITIKEFLDQINLLSWPFISSKAKRNI